MPSPSQAPGRVLLLADHWFDRARSALLGELPCRRGCCRCCIGPFPITILDLAELHRGLSCLDEPLRRDIKTEAAAQRLAMETSFPRLLESRFVDDWPEGEVDSVVARFADLPCPALGPAGECRVYGSRPVTCRTMGIPVEANGLVEGACEVQTAVPVIRPSSVFRREEQTLADKEAAGIQSLRREKRVSGEEMLLPYGFLGSSEET